MIFQFVLVESIQAVRTVIILSLRGVVSLGVCYHSKTQSIRILVAYVHKYLFMSAMNSLLFT